MLDKLKSKKVLITIAAIVVAIGIIGSWWYVQKNVITVPNTYNYDDLTEYITLGKYKGIKYTKKVKAVSDSDVKSEIKSAIQNATTTKDVKSGTVGKKSKVKIDYEGKINGKTFDGGSSEDYTLDIANDSMIDGFSEGIVGHKVGDKFKLNLKFPSDYSNSDVAGKKVVFTITVKAIVKTVTPEYNDAFVKKNTKYKTTTEYEKSIRKKLKKQNEEDALTDAYSSIFSTIVKNTKVKKYPKEELSTAQNTMKSTYKKLAEQYNMEYSDFLKQYMNMDESTFNKQVKVYAKNTVKQQMVERQLAKELDINITSKEYRAYINQLLSDNNMTKDTFEEQAGTTLKKYAEQNNLYDSMLYNRVMEKVITYCKEK